jgi:hypothetical protein
LSVNPVGDLYFADTDGDGIDYARVGHGHH